MKLPEELRIALARAGVALCLLILYLLSVGPAVYFDLDGAVSWNTFRVLYGPAIAVAESSLPYRNYIAWWKLKRTQALVAESRLESTRPETGSR